MSQKSAPKNASKPNLSAPPVTRCVRQSRVSKATLVLHLTQRLRPSTIRRVILSIRHMNQLNILAVSFRTSSTSLKQRMAVSPIIQPFLTLLNLRVTLLKDYSKKLPTKVCSLSSSPDQAKQRKASVVSVRCITLMSTKTIFVKSLIT